MYVYIYATGLQQPKLKKIADRIEVKLTELGIGGTTHHLTVLKSASQVITEEIAKGAETIVLVGDDALFYEALSLVAKKPVALGYIPLGGNSPLARYCGIPQGILACHVIANRLLVSLDLGKIHNHYFFDCVEVDNKETQIRCDGKITITPPATTASVAVYNAPCRPTKSAFLPTDGNLYLVIPNVAKKSFFSGVGDPSVFPAKKFSIRARSSVAIRSHGKKIATSPADIVVVPKALKLIVGKDRMF